MPGELRKYPVNRPTTAPATGKLFHDYLLEPTSVKNSGSAAHNIWYRGMAMQLANQEEHPFRGRAHKGDKIELLTLSGEPIKASVGKRKGDSVVYTLKGVETILVSDLTDRSKQELGIPAKARDKDKVYNPNFVEYEQLDPVTKMSNELPALILPKSFSSYYAGLQGKVNYSEVDVLNFLTRCFTDLSSQEMMHLMSHNHMAWATASFIRSGGNTSGDVKAEFWSQNPPDFYQKDLGTLLPALFFAIASLGKDPVEFQQKLDVEVWGSKENAEYMRQYMPKKA